MSSFVERMARSGEKGEKRGLRSLQAMAIRMREKAKTLPRKLDPEIWRQIWDETWAEYTGNAKRLHELGFRREGNTSFRVGPPLTSGEANEVDALTGGYGF